jgi:hypothetical protein
MTASGPVLTSGDVAVCAASGGIADIECALIRSFLNLMSTRPSCWVARSIYVISSSSSPRVSLILASTNTSDSIAISV